MYNKYENCIISLTLVNLLLHVKIKVIGGFIFKWNRNSEFDKSCYIEALEFILLYQIIIYIVNSICLFFCFWKIFLTINATKNS